MTTPISKMQLNPKHVAQLLKLVNASSYPDLLNFKLSAIEIGTATVELVLNKEKHHQPFGVVHGGVIASLIDTACFWAAYGNLQNQEDGLTSVDLKLNYLAPGQTGLLTANGRLIKIGKKIGYAEATVVDESGTIIGHGTSTVMVLPGKGLTTPYNLADKFI